MNAKHYFAALAALLAMSSVHAATLTWDTNSADGAAITHGDGTWNLSNAFWNTGSGNVAWTNAPLNDAVFAGNTSGVTTVTIGANALSAGRITVNGNGGTMVLKGTYANLKANLLTVQTGGAGKLAINAAGTLANVAAISVANGATLYLSGSTVSSVVTVTGSGNTENYGALRVEGNARLQGTINLAGDATFGAHSGTGNIESTVSGNFAFNQAASGTGVVRLSGNNSYTGGTTIAASIVQAGHQNAFGSGTLRLNGGTLSSDSTTARTLPNAVTIGGSAVLGNATNSGKLTFTGTTQSSLASATLTTNSAVEFADMRASGAIAHAGSASMILGGTFTALSANAALTGNAITLGAAGTTFGTNGFAITVSAPLSGSAGLTKTGMGTLSMSAAGSTFLGPVEVSGGTLRLAAAVALPANLKIMPMGDSITYGAGSAGGYRASLYNLLQPIAPGVQFVGDSTLNAGSLPVGQQNHAGHSSYSTLDIFRNLDGLDTKTLTTYRGADRDPHGGYWLTGGDGTPNRAPLSPDVILLLVGTNDVYRADTGVTDKKASYTNLLAKLTALRPNAEIFMAKITPYSPPSPTQIQRVNDYNAIVTKVYGEFKAAGKKVTLVDLNSGYPAGAFVDSLHPNATGYNWMATRWRDALTDTLGIESPLDFRSASSITVDLGATLKGTALVRQLSILGTIAPGDDGVGSISAENTTISGAYLCDLATNKGDRLTITGDLELRHATLNLTLLGTPTASSYTIATYTGTLTGSFATVNGMPAGYQLVNDTSGKRIVIKQVP